ncbi:MAG: DUF3501 family protein [Chloroflexi bacterium]|nr:DUF3501 family protein [Chloroflexota bacterium]
MNTKLTLEDIADLRAYERERAELRTRIIALKRRRRVAVGPIVTLLFENRETVRFQVQEMARAERMIADAQIQAELDVYNPLIPAPGELTATLFVELASKAELTDWLPRLVGVERSVELRLGRDSIEVIQATPDEAHAAQLTRETTTAAVHFIRFRLTAAQVERFARGPVALALNHPSYRHETRLAEETRASLLADLR